MIEAHEERTLSEAQLRFHADETRLRGKRGALLELLFDGKWHPNHQCAEITLCFHSAIYGLRREGWVIESRHGDHGCWHYRLVGKTEPAPPTQRMNPQQRRVAVVYSEAITNNLGEAALARALSHVPCWLRLDPPSVQYAETTPLPVTLTP
jgi:hypothetical protein